MLQITGYADRIHCRPGDTIKFMVNCEFAGYQAELVRIICGDDNPNGPGIKEETIDAPFAGARLGRRQEIRSGSCIQVPDCEATAGLDAAVGLKDFTVQAYIWPTAPLKGRQGIITKWSAREKSGFALIVDEHGIESAPLSKRKAGASAFSSRPSLRCPISRIAGRSRFRTYPFCRGRIGRR